MIPFEEWCASDQHRLRQMARDPELKPLKFRVMFAAEGWGYLHCPDQTTCGEFTIVPAGDSWRCPTHNAEGVEP